MERDKNQHNSLSKRPTWRSRVFPNTKTLLMFAWAWKSRNINNLPWLAMPNWWRFPTLNQLVCCINCRLWVRIRVQVTPVKVLTMCVGSVMASVNSIRIENWNDDKHKVVQSQLDFDILARVGQNVSKEAVQHVRSSYLTRMNSRTQVNVALPIELEGSFWGFWVRK